MRSTNTIVLIGMMGAGKTTLGVMAAERLGREFIDADRVLEDAAGMDIPAIFRRHGEAEFRRLEYETLRDLLARPGQRLVATGGGAFCQERVRDLLRGRALTVFLNVPEAELLRRLALANPADRPMLSGDWRDRVRSLVAARYPLYQLADLAVPIGDESPEQSLERLLASLPHDLAPAPAQVGVDDAS